MGSYRHMGTVLYTAPFLYTHITQTTRTGIAVLYAMTVRDLSLWFYRAIRYCHPWRQNYIVVKLGLMIWNSEGDNDLQRFCLLLRQTHG